MSNFLWSKPGAEQPDQAMMDFLAGDDVLLDRQLLNYDIQATMAHVNGLQRIDILQADEAREIAGCLQQMAAAVDDGSYQLGPPHEDGHSAIEAYVSERLGDLGRKLHTGRSRNDQVLVATRLFLKDQLALLGQSCLGLAEAALQRAEQDGDLPMPGYTHLQRAVPSSVGLWMAAFAEAYLDNALLAWRVRQHLDQCPLGTAAGYGVNLPLDRQGVADELGFARLQINPMYAQNSRGKFELLALQALAQASHDLRRLSWDLSLYTTAEFGFVQLPPTLRTGSSIMPNKANPDLIELLRATHGIVQGAQIELDAVTALPSAYHRDLQNTKAAMLRPWSPVLNGLALAARLLQEIRFDSTAMTAAINAEMYATDKAIRLAASGVPFREAYRQSNGDNADSGGQRPEESLKQRVSPGACGNLMLPELRRRQAETKALLQKD
ncbi:MAG: argininosuccinate lyase [Wenzhouxiangellaceae bacterium]